MNENYPCKCGHKEQDHKFWNGFKTTRCEICVKPHINSGWNDKDGSHWQAVQDSWHNFKQDNLKYLELKYEEKLNG